MRKGLAALVALALTSPAVAEVRPSDINRPVGEDGLGPGYGGNRTQWELELVGFFGSGTEARGLALDRLNVAPTIRIATPERRNDFELVGALISHRQSFDATDSVRQALLLSNLYLGYHWAWRRLDRQFRLGLGATLPTANLPSASVDETAEALDAYAWSAAMRGWRELWLWTPETLTFTGHVDYYHRRASGLIVGGQAIMGWMNRVTNSKVVAESELVAQVDLDLIYDLDTLRLGLRAGVVALPLTEADEKLQASVEPESRFRLGPVDLVARFTMPINAPAGFAFSEGGAWAVHLGVSNATSQVLPKE